MNQFFYEDQVYKVDKKGVKFGLVVENEVSFPLSEKSCPGQDFFFVLRFFSDWTRIFPQIPQCHYRFNIHGFLFQLAWRFLAMRSMRIIPKQKKCYAKESWGLVTLFSTNTHLLPHSLWLQFERVEANFFCSLCFSSHFFAGDMVSWGQGRNNFGKKCKSRDDNSYIFLLSR